MRRSTSLLLAALALAPAASPVTGAPGPASLVRDIALGEERPPWFSDPALSQLVPVGDRVLFTAAQADSGREVWVADGKPGGTRLLVDLCPGPCWSDSHILTTLGNFAFLTADPNRQDAIEIWRTDGTRGGTFRLESEGLPLLVERYDDLLDPRIDWFLLDGAFHFEACVQGGAPCGLWRTDGTRSGTRLVLEDFASSYAVLGDFVYFFRSSELLRFDGKRGTTSFVAPISGHTLIAAQNKVFFIAQSDGEELWVSDGTQSGTRRLTDFLHHSPFNNGYLYSNVVRAFGPRVYVLADDGVNGQEIWVSDGTPGGTRQATSFEYALAFRNASSRPWEPFLLEGVGEQIIFEAYDGISPRRLWISDGHGSAVPFESFCPGGCFANVPLQSLLRVGKSLLFVAEDTAHGWELWSTDGTPAGTRIVRDLCPGPCSSGPFNLQPLAGGALFLSRDRQGQARAWRTDGTAKGTRAIARLPDAPNPGEIFREAASAGGRLFVRGNQNLWVVEAAKLRQIAGFSSMAPASSNPEQLTPAGDSLFFVTDETLSERLWKTLGTEESTIPLQEESGSPHGLTAVGSSLYFVLEASSPRRLWRSDGSTEPARPIDLPSGVELGYVPFAALGNRLFFQVLLAGGATEVWFTDGTSQGTGPAFRPAGGEVFSISSLTNVGGEIYFSALVRRDIGFQGEVWRSDGSAAGTHRVIALPDSNQFPEWFVRAGNRVFFATRSGPSRLWSTDGTTTGTRLLGEFGSLDPADLVEHQGVLFFFSNPGGLFRSDGTEEGTVLIRGLSRSSVEPLEFPLPSPVGLVSAGGRLFFFADDGQHGIELWSSDGTPGGTSLVRDVAAGARSSAPSGLTAAGGLVFFSAHDGDHGFELWSSDGTAAGTRLVQDLHPGASSSLPEQLTSFGDRLYFAADDGLTGRELWSLPLAGTGGCQTSPTRLCLNGGRYQVEVSWRDFQSRIGRGVAVSLSSDTGYFWFFDPANAEVIVKVLNGEGINQHVWVFYGALSNVEYTLTVTDTQTGLARRYLNPSGQLASVGDTTGFGPLGAHSAVPDVLVAPPSPPALVSGRTVPAAATGSCQPGPRRLCLNGGRFAVQASWKDFQGNTGAGTAVPLTPDTGYFWFFDAANVEVLLKVLDGTPLNGHFWLFYGALSNVEYTLTVTDTQTGAVKEYRNPSGRFASVADTEAF